MRRESGFTLLEIMVVVVILAVMVGSIGLELHATEGVTVRDQSRRLALLVHALRQQAIVDGTPLAVRFGRQSYTFMTLNLKGRWVPLTGDHLLRRRQLPAGVRFQVALHAPAGQRMVEISPGGLITPFTARLTDGDSHWKVVGLANGTIAAKPSA